MKTQACWLLSLSASSGGCSAVVMVKAVEDGARQDATGELWRARNGLLLADALVRPCLIVEDDERGEQAPEVLVAKHEDVVEQLPPERAHEALSEGVHVRRAYGAADDLRSGGLEDRCESDTQLPITVSDQDFGLVVRSGIPGLLRTPVVGGHRGGSCVNDLAALEVDEEQDEKRAEESIEGLNEVTAPGDVVLDEGAPFLSVTGDASGHVPLHGALREVDSQFEELPANSLCSPSRIESGHLANERGVTAQLPPARPRAPAPEEAKARAVPPQDRGRLDQGDSRAPRRRGDRHVSDEPPLRRGEADAFALEPALRCNQLLSQHLVFGDERQA